MHRRFTLPADFSLRLPAGPPIPLRTDDWEQLLAAAQDLRPLIGVGPGASPEHIDAHVAELAVRELITDVLGIRGEHLDDVFFHRYGADLAACIQAQLWFKEACRLLAGAANGAASSGITLPAGTLSIRRRLRLRDWGRRARVLTERLFPEFVNAAVGFPSARAIVSRARSVAASLDKEDLEILVNTGLALAGDADIRRNLEILFRETMLARFEEDLSPDPCACVWHVVAPKPAPRATGVGVGDLSTVS